LKVLWFDFNIYLYSEFYIVNYIFIPFENTLFKIGNKGLIRGKGSRYVAELKLPTWIAVLLTTLIVYVY